jgi:primosomal protein N' (replication factor Y)
LGEQLSKAFPRAFVHRVDPSAPDELPSDPIDIYLTTWMGTKAALRPDVSLVGILDADWLIRRPDFRAAESAYQACVEMAEWAGPRDRGGHLVIQTVEPDHHSLQAIVRSDYSFFLRNELEQRRELMYPPFIELVKVVIAGARAEPFAAHVSASIRHLATRILGPMPMARADGPPTVQLLIKCTDVMPVARALRDILEASPKGTRMSVDVDPR